MRAVWTGLILATAMLAVSAPAGASSLEANKATCLTGSGATGVRACTWLLQNWRTTNKNRSAVFSNRGVAYALIGQHRYALYNFNLALRLNPRDEKTYFNRGKTFVAYRNYRAALIDFNRALRLKPDYVAARINRGVVYAAARRYPKALEDFDAALKAEPNNVNGLVNRGLANERLGDRANAIDDYRLALKHDPDNRRARAGLARLGARP